VDRHGPHLLVDDDEPWQLIGGDDAALAAAARERPRVVDPAAGVETDPPPLRQVDHVVEAPLAIDEQREADPLLLHQPARLVRGADRDPECGRARRLDFVQVIGDLLQVVPAGQAAVVARDYDGRRPRDERAEPGVGAIRVLDRDPCERSHRPWRPYRPGCLSSSGQPGPSSMPSFHGC